MDETTSAYELEKRFDGWVVGGYTGEERHLSIPSHIDDVPVVLISKEAFQGNPNLVSVEVPETVKFIGNFAFASCSSLETVVLDARLAALNLNTFASCPALRDVKLPGTLEKIGDGAFRECTGLQTLDVPSSVTEIGDSAFRNCTSLRSMVLDGAITAIQRNAFRDCVSLSTVVVPSSLSYIGPRAFQGCTMLESVSISGGLVSDTLNAFKNHSMTYLVADYALERKLMTFEEGKKLFNSKLPLEKVFAARIIASYPEQLERFPMKSSLAKTLAAGGCVDELKTLAAQPGLLSESLVHECIDAAGEAGKTETVAYLLDLSSSGSDDSGVPSAFDSMKL